MSWATDRHGRPGLALQVVVNALIVLAFVVGYLVLSIPMPE